MKKLVAFILAMIMMLSAFTACGNVGGISDYPAELEEAGISQKEYEAMSDEQKQAILDELGIKAELGTDKEGPKPTEKPKAATIEDVENTPRMTETDEVSDFEKAAFAKLHEED